MSVSFGVGPTSRTSAPAVHRCARVQAGNLQARGAHIGQTPFRRAARAPHRLTGLSYGETMGQELEVEACQ